MMEELLVSSPSFENGAMMPKKHTVYGENVSPAFHLANLSKDAKTLVIIMEDLDRFAHKTFPHWLIWNIPAQNDIFEAISQGAIVKELDNAFQGVAYGKNGYRGPKIPRFFNREHRYCFTVYALDEKLDLLFSAEKKQLLKAMENHVLQKGQIIGVYKR